MERAVADERQRGDGFAARGAAFEERVAVGVEEMAGAGGHREVGMFAAAVDDAEEGEELRPRAEAVVHGVRVTLGIGAQSLEESTHGVVPDVKPAAGQQPAVFGEEGEHEPEQHGDEPAVDVVGITGGEFAEEFALGAFVRGLEAAQEFVEGVEDLFGENFRDAGLVVAAALEQRGEAGVAGGVEERPRAEEQLERAEDEPARHFGHRADGERERTGVFLGRRVDEAELRAVGEQADGHAGLAQEALEFFGRRGVPVALGTGDGFVEVHRGRVGLDEEKIGGIYDRLPIAD